MLHKWAFHSFLFIFFFFFCLFVARMAVGLAPRRGDFRRGDFGKTRSLPHGNVQGSFFSLCVCVCVCVVSVQPSRETAHGSTSSSSLPDWKFGLWHVGSKRTDSRVPHRGRPFQWGRQEDGVLDWYRKLCSRRAVISFQISSRTRWWHLQTMAPHTQTCLFYMSRLKSARRLGKENWTRLKCVDRACKKNKPVTYRKTTSRWNGGQQNRKWQDLKLRISPKFSEFFPRKILK